MQYDDVVETHEIIDLPDGKKMHGVLRGELPFTTPLVIIMHGLIGDAKALLPYLGSRFLHQAGYSTLCLYMYDFEDQYRNVFDCSLDNFISDYEAIVDYYRDKGVSDIYAVGHSLGGLTILAACADIDAAVLWDPSHGLAFSPERWNNQVGNILINTQGRGYMRPKKIQDELMQLKDTTGLARGLVCPTKIITGSNSALNGFATKYFELLPNKNKDLISIENAGHSFNEQDHITLQLFSETANWFDTVSDVRQQSRDT